VVHGEGTVRFRSTYRQPEAARYRSSGGAWDVPALDRLLSTPRLPDATAIVDGGVSIDARTFDRLADSVAAGLRARGVRRGDVVAWQLPNWWEALVLFHACWRSGAVAAPIHHQVGSTEVARMQADLQPTVALAGGDLPLAALADAIGVRTGDPRFEDLLDAAPVAATRPRGSDVAVVLFTSGSTGYPKAVFHTHRGLAYKAHTMARAHGLTSADVALMPSPLAHVSGLLNSVLVPGAAAMTVVLMEKWDAERGVRLAAEHRASYMIGPPTLVLGMLDVPGCRDKVTTMRVISCGSTGVTPEFVDAAREGFGAMVKRTYGSTEAPTVTTTCWDDPPEMARDTDGRAVGDAVVLVAEPGTVRPVPSGERGEVLVRGPELFVGYGDGSQTAEAVRRGWFATGDLGTLDPDGWLTIVGRLKELIIRGGENIASAEVERVLELHPGVRQAVVVGTPDARLGERVVAFVVGDRAIDVAECRRWFADREVARFKTPELVVHLEEIPVLGVGKPDRTALRERAAALSVAG